MTSIHTNTAAMAAAETLRGISAGLNRTQTNVSSGLRVGSASDNAGYWSISTTMKSDSKALSSVSDAIGFTAAVLDTAYAGMEAVEREFTAIRNLIIQASQMPPPGYSSIPMPYEQDPVYAQSQQAKITNDINQHFGQVRTAVESASFGGVNLLYMGDGSAKVAGDVVNSFVTGYANGRVQSSDLALMDTLMINDSWADDTSSLPNYPSAGQFDHGFFVTMKFASGPDSGLATRPSTPGRSTLPSTERPTRSTTTTSSATWR